MKCKTCRHEKLDHMEYWNGRLVPTKCDYINCKCKKFISQEEMKI